MAKLCMFDLEILCLRAAGKTEGEADRFMDNEQDIDDFCYENFECDFDSFCKIADKLVDFTPICEEELSKKSYQGFFEFKERGGGLNYMHAIAAKEVI